MTCCSVPGCRCADPDCFCSDCRREIRERKKQQRRERMTMNEELMYRIMMFSGMVLAILAGCGALALLVVTATDYSHAGLGGAAAMAGASVAFGWAGVHFGQRASGHQRVFDNAAEREVLNPKQRRELRIARGSVVMQRALMEIDDEREKLIARELEGPKDDDDDVVKPEPLEKSPQWNRTGYEGRVVDPYEHDDDRRPWR